MITNKIPKKNIKIFKEKAGVLSDTEVWVCMYEDFIHIQKDFYNLVKEVKNEFRNIKHLIG